MELGTAWHMLLNWEYVISILDCVEGCFGITVVTTTSHNICTLYTGLITIIAVEAIHFNLEP
jgi:hypothetical protein